jgi:hypothetical protein
MKHRLILIFLLLGVPLVAGATDYFVGSAATGSGDCSSGGNRCTLATVESHITLGSAAVCAATGGWQSDSGIGACIHVANGTYSSAITTNKAGTASARIRYICDTQYGCKLNQSSSGTIWTVNGAYTDMVGFDFDGSGHAGVTTGLTAFTQDFLAQGNRFHDIGSGCGTTNNAAAASFFNTQPGHGNRYISNLFYHNNCGAGHPSSAGNAMSALGLDSYDIAQNNTVLDHGSGYAVQVSHGFPINGIYTCVNGTFSNNTVANVDRGVIVGFCSNTIDSYIITNNIVANVAGGTGAAIRVHESAGCGTNNVYANNLMYGSTGYMFDSPGCPNTSTGTQTGSNSTTFVNYTGTASGDYRPKDGSTAIGAGVVLGAPATDFAGLTRSAPYDIGAFKFGSESATSPPSPPTGLTAMVQ